MKTALIIGANSTIGGALGESLAGRGIDVSAIGRAALDLAQSPAQWPALPQADVAYLCAAVTGLDVCESDPEATRRVNVTHMQALAQKLQAQGTFVIFLSSNQVMDGSKPYAKTTDAPHPMNEYGRQKHDFERWLLAQPLPAAVLRLTKVIAAPLPLLAKWQASLEKGETVEAFDDLVFAPLPLAAVVEALTELGEKRAPGLFHLSGTRDISYAEIAALLANKIGADPALVRPTSARAKGIPANFLPRHGTLATNMPHIPVSDPERFIT